jgi:hypothetical protein
MVTSKPEAARRTAEARPPGPAPMMATEGEEGVLFM